MRRLVAALAMTLALASGCTNDDPPVSGRLLQVADLPAKPAETSDADRLPPVGSSCQMEFGGVLGPSFKVIGVEYSDVEGSTITSLVSTNADVSEDRLPQIRSEIERCASGAQESSKIKVIDLGSNNAAFTAEAYDDAEAPAGEVAFTRVKKSYVIVAVTAPTGADETSSKIDLAALLDAAVDRAAS